MIQTSDLVGAWQLESWTIGYSNSDKLSNPFGEDPQGLLLYTADGWMSASVCRPDRSPLPEGESPRTLPDAAKAEAYASYFHYAGRFRVQGGDVIHYVSQSLNPNFPGSEQLRHAELDGQTLVLSGKDQVGEVTRFHSLVWHRVPRTEPDLPPIDSE
ncbi:lipocalin-like domain-containing protein [Parahaliea aestuarii]|uniref:Lipocalin-like domain-containing protein n=1 Tax=Parahaliea aestuarii TaxID=1852021 RepID=A0A5C8ZKZ6_9GAMM|nr:lipocalin-like domain-containing protein [Parahaliea aestuarii]TXS89118.1 lipocalin-like domain-containing protein [Parahaliea aestuarii]